jgi:hypothetical protein
VDYYRFEVATPVERSHDLDPHWPNVWSCSMFERSSKGLYAIVVVSKLELYNLKSQSLANAQGLRLYQLKKQML